VAYNFSMRKLNTQLLRSYLVIQGKLSKETLAVEAGISVVKIDRMLRGKREATKPEMLALCKVTGYEIDQLFPVVENKKESA
jgi:transcriptional regulator with XRE-family HTH domain